MATHYKNEACRTYLEQTKLLVTLASAFIIAPAIFIEKIDVSSGLSIVMELCFILSVFSGYVVFGTISGTQFKGEYNVYNSNTIWSSRIQIALFILGLILLLANFGEVSTKVKLNSPEKHEISNPSINHPLDSTVQFRNIFFDSAKWTLRPESYYELSSLTNELKSHPNLKISIEAHTDSRGTTEFNYGLSERRIGSVVQYLISQGVPAHQLSSIGFGESIPLTTNSTYEGRQINRRIEIKIIEIN